MFVHFFKGLYKKQPKLFYLFGSFFILQLFFAAIKLEVTPFFLYGMFSEKAAPKTFFTEKEIWVNGKKLTTKDLWIQEALLLDETSSHYISIKQNNNVDVVQSRVEQRYGFLTNSFLYPFMSQRIYNTPAAVIAYERWFKNKCSSILNEPVSSVKIIENTYKIDQQRTTIKLSHSETVASF
jgi:hypothetical protein